MASLTRVVAAAVLFCASSGTGARDTKDENCHSFKFGEEQAKEWGKCWPECSRGHKQSPINVQANNATTVDLPHVKGSFYRSRHLPLHFNITNVKYTVRVQFENAGHLYVEGGPLEGHYYLDRLEFRWGSDDSLGSDHAFNGERFPMEAQWGLYKDEYENFDEASKYPGGVLLISQLYPLVESPNPSLAYIVSGLVHVTKPGQTWTSDEPMMYDQLFSGYPVDDYYYYDGSLTTPPCSETAVWFVYPPLNGVSEKQLKAFRALRSTDGPLVNNYRSLQPLGDRVVVRSDKGSSCLGNCDAETPPIHSWQIAGRRHRATTTTPGRQRAGRRHKATTTTPGRQRAGRRHKATMPGRQHAARRKGAAHRQRRHHHRRRAMGQHRKGTPPARHQ